MPMYSGGSGGGSSSASIIGASGGASASNFQSIGLFSSILSAFGQVYEGYQSAKAEELNASLARSQKELVRARAKIDVMRQRKVATSFRSTQEALYSKAGVELTGSPLAVIEESAANAELDMLMTELDAYSKESQLEFEATERETSARSAQSSGIVRAGKTLLTAGTKYYTEE